jgi:hypothetical protein
VLHKLFVQYLSQAREACLVLIHADQHALFCAAQIHRELLRRLNAVGRIDWSRGVVDSSHIRALQGGLTGPSRVDRDRTGSEHHLMVDAAGVPLTVTLTGGNRNDITQLLLLVDRITPVVGRIGCPRQRPDQIVAERGYDHDSYRRKLWRRGVKPSIAQCGTEHGAFLTLTCALICRRYLGGFETGSKVRRRAMLRSRLLRAPLLPASRP